MAKVEGIFYEAQRLRRGSTPTSPQYDGSEGQPSPVNPTTSVTPPVAIRYTSEANMIAGQINQRSGYLYYDGTNTWWYKGIANGLISDYVAFGGGGGDGMPPVDESYASQAAMIADQGSQTANYIYYDSNQYWEYLGTTSGTIADYRAFGGLWTAGSGFIYRNGRVVFGRTTLPTNGTFAFKCTEAAPSSTEQAYKYFVIENFEGQEHFSIKRGGETNLYNKFTAGQPATNLALGGATLKGLAVNGNTDSIFSILNSSEVKVLEIREAYGLINYSNRPLFGGVPSTNICPAGATFKGASANGNTTSIFRIINSSDALVLDVIQNYFTFYNKGFVIGSPTTPISLGFHYKGNFNNTSPIFRIDNSSNTAIMTILGDGDISFSEGSDWSFGTTTGTKIGASTTQKLSFWNKTPIIQPTTGITGATRVGGGGTTITTTDTFGGYTVAQLAAILINTGLTA